MVHGQLSVLTKLPEEWGIHASCCYNFISSDIVFLIATVSFFWWHEIYSLMIYIRILFKYYGKRA